MDAYKVLNNVKVTPAQGQQARKTVMTQMHVNRKVIEAVQRLSLETGLNTQRKEFVTWVVKREKI